MCFKTTCGKCGKVTWQGKGLKLFQKVVGTSWITWIYMRCCTSLQYVFVYKWNFVVGCGKHAEQVMKDVPEAERCNCPRKWRLGRGKYSLHSLKKLMLINYSIMNVHNYTPVVNSFIYLWWSSHSYKFYTSVQILVNNDTFNYSQC
jgi:hypothetical protein